MKYTCHNNVNFTHSVCECLPQTHAPFQSFFEGWLYMPRKDRLGPVALNYRLKTQWYKLQTYTNNTPTSKCRSTMIPWESDGLPKSR